MVTLYQFHYNWQNIPSSIFLLGLGIAFLFYKIADIPKVADIPKGNTLRALFRFFLKVLGIVCIFFAVYTTVLSIKDYTEKRSALANNQVYVVEGYVENYHPRPFTGHDTERFEINGVSFTYPSGSINGYETPACYGGVITQNGQYLLIKYVTESDGSNTILFIQRLE